METPATAESAEGSHSRDEFQFRCRHSFAGCTCGTCVRIYFFGSLRSCESVSQRAFWTGENVWMTVGIPRSGEDTKTRVNVDRVVHPQVQIQVADALEIFGGQLNVRSL